jgi:hypothetical protein
MAYRFALRPNNWGELIMFRLSVFVCAAASLVFGLSSVAAQKYKDGELLPPIRVALVAQLPPSASLHKVDGTRAMIIRKGGERDEDLILVTNETMAPDLARAAFMLLRGRDSKFKKETGEIRAYVPPTTSRELPGVGYSEELLVRLRTAPTQSIRGFGVVRTVEMKVRVRMKKANE